MALLDMSRPMGASAPTSMAMRFFSALADWNDARLTRKTLNALSDRELNDIGLVRGDIDEVARPR